MKPKWQPIPLRVECSPYGESAFQPLMVTASGVVVAGGPGALSLIDVGERPHLMRRIRARVRIAGFTVHGSDLYVQDGPVLSRWSLGTGRRISAINLANPERRWHEGAHRRGLEWLYALPEELDELQKALQRARRRMEWVHLLEAAEAELAASPAEPLRRMVAELEEVVGGRDEARAELAERTRDAAELIFSAPVVRQQQVGAKKGGRTFVLSAAGTLHPLGNALETRSSAALDSGARPSLAMVELATAAHDDKHACRLFYVADDGDVRMVNGDALPLRELPSWPSRGPASMEPGVRPRVESGLLWGSDAQGTGIFALPIARPGSASRVTLPTNQRWRWLELRPDFELALATGDEEARLVSYAQGAKGVERWAPRPGTRAAFSTFLPQAGDPERPLLVVEVDREARPGEAGVEYRLLVANTVDAPEPLPWFPPAPTVLARGALEGWMERDDAEGDPDDAVAGPAHVRAQPSVSRQDAYVVARDRTPRQEIAALLDPGHPGSWRRQRAAILEACGGDVKRARAARLPRLAGRDVLYTYGIGASVSSHQAEEAVRVVEHLRDQTIPVRLRLRSQVIQNRSWGPPESGPVEPVRDRITLHFDGGDALTVVPDSDGLVILPPERTGQRVTMDPVRFRRSPLQEEPPRAIDSDCVLRRPGENVIHQKLLVRTY